ncbi:MAG TPA: hydroxyacid dehydrogenase [Candidatus Brocadiia bacterium]|nr:hydroxyacid dehydrogenase [Candidatus Brocadiia bacterium]
MAMRKAAIAFVFPRSTFEDCFHIKERERLRAVASNWHDAPEKITPGAVEAEIRGAEIWLGGWGAKFTPAMIEAHPELKLYCHSAGSIKGLIPENYWKLGKRVVTANAAIALGVAETSLAMLIMGLKRFIPHWRNIRAGGWRAADVSAKTKEMTGITIGVVSAGAVGREVLKLLGNFDVRRLLFDPFVDAETAAKLGAEKVGTLMEMAPQLDGLVLATPKLQETNKMIGREFLRALPDDAVLVNCSRGAVIDEAALIEELQRGRLFALLDVTEPEPPAVDSPLRSLDNVFITPHIAGAITNGRHRQGRLILDEIERYLAGEKMIHEVTEERFVIMA